MADELDRTDLETEFPGWKVWESIMRTFYYARWVGSTPPIVVRAATLAELQDKIKQKVYGDA
jgi:hypothetical protein